MTLLSAKKQVVSIHEAVAGVTPTGAMTNGSNADILLNSAEPTFDVEYIDREFLRTTITKLKSIPGQKTGGVTMTTELVGNATDVFSGGVPAWSKFMEMAGFRLVVLDRVNIGTQAGWTAGSGPIRHGEIITDTTGGDTARVIGDVHYQSGSGYLYYEALTGTMTPSEVWTTGTTNFSFVAGATIEASCGWAWVPVSQPEKFVTIASGTFVEGNVYEGSTSGQVVVASRDGTSVTRLYFRGGGGLDNSETLTLISGTGSNLTVGGAANEAYSAWPTGSIRLNEDGVAVDFVASRANVSFAFEVNRPVVMTFTTRGRWDSADSGSDLNGVGDTPQVAGSEAVIDPKLWAGQAVGIGVNETLADMDFADNRTPCLKTMTLDAGVTLADVKCAHSPEGLLEIVGSTRSGSGSLEANATNEGDIPWLGTFRSGEVVRLSTQIGGAAGDPTGGFVFQMPAIQYTGAASGDIDGILTRNMDFSLNAAVINNLVNTGGISSTTGDNELILMYIVTP
tara:strand:- start:15465 stop:16991 length:1527 start_codon:yes stop_codon:yes gene_type:complete